MARTITISVTEEDYNYLRANKSARTLRMALALARDQRKASPDEVADVEEAGGFWKFIKGLKQRIFFLQEELNKRQDKLEMIKEEFGNVSVVEEVVLEQRRVSKTRKSFPRIRVAPGEDRSPVSILERDSKQKTLFESRDL